MLTAATEADEHLDDAGELVLRAGGVGGVALTVVSWWRSVAAQRGGWSEGAAPVRIDRSSARNWPISSIR